MLKCINYESFEIREMLFIWPRKIKHTYTYTVFKEVTKTYYRSGNCFLRIASFIACFIVNIAIYITYVISAPEENYIYYQVYLYPLSTVAIVLTVFLPA